MLPFFFGLKKNVSFPLIPSIFTEMLFAGALVSGSCTAFKLILGG
jgi:hypothetical protein